MLFDRQRREMRAWLVRLYRILYADILCDLGKASFDRFIVS
jgi:hypothetical protein